LHIKHILYKHIVSSVMNNYSSKAHTSLTHPFLFMYKTEIRNNFGIIGGGLRQA